MKQTVYAITGANGQLGKYLVNYLRQKNMLVYELVRSEEKAQDKKYFKFFDLAQPKTVPSLQGIDVLIHCAYFFDVSDIKAYRRINLEGSEALLSAASTHDIYSVLISSLSAYQRARSHYGKTKFAIEQLLPNKSVIIRPGLILSDPLEGIAAAIENVIKKFSVVPLINRGEQLIYPCRIENLAELIFKISVAQPILKEPILAAAEQPLTFRQLVQFLCHKQQKPVLKLPVPFYVLYFALRTLEWCGISIGLRSDSLLGLQYTNPDLDFYQSKTFQVCFEGID